MPETIDILVPDIGDFSEVEVVEIHIGPGSVVDIETPLVTLESDKASIDVPSPAAGTVATLTVSMGDHISQGTRICTLTVSNPPAADAAREPDAEAMVSASAAPTDVGAYDGDPIVETQVLVIGAGPGGYTAAFRSADLGQRTTLVERYETLGGVCLNVGCIPSKALLHTADVMRSVEAMASHGVTYGAPTIDLPALRDWKGSVVGKLTKGLAGLAKQRGVDVVHGTAVFTSPHSVRVEGPEGPIHIRFQHAIIAAGSQATQIPAFPNDDPRLMDSTDALELDTIPERLLVVGGGIIGLEMATVFAALGTRVTVVELLDGLMPGCDRDLVRVLQNRIKKQYENIFLGTRVTGMRSVDAGIEVSFDGENAPPSDVFERVLVAVGRRPNGHHIGAAEAGVAVDEAGFISVDRQCRTNVPHIYAIGDIVGQPMLAHKATHEGKVAAEVIAGHKVSFDALTIPSVAYTDPEVAWMGKTEEQANAEGLEFEKAVFPWAASGRAIGIGRDEGFTKLLFDTTTKRLIGAGIVGVHAGDLIAETVLALEMGADAQDLGLSVHPHPTLSETVNFAAEIAEGTITDLYVPRRK